MYYDYEKVMNDAIEYKASEEMVLDIIDYCPNEHQDTLLNVGVHQMIKRDENAKIASDIPIGSPIYFTTPIDYWMNLIDRLVMSET